MSLLQEMGDFGGVLVGFLLTISVLSYVIRDNPLYRLAVHVLVGVSAAYAVIVVVRQVFAPVWTALRVDISGNGLLWIVPLILSLMLLLKALPRTTSLGNGAMATLMAIGSAVAFVGAVAGTLLPQVLMRQDNAPLGLLLAVLSICTLAYFVFTGRKGADGNAQLPRWYSPVSILGRIVITMTLAGLFAGILNTSLVILTERMSFFIEAFRQLITEFVA